RVAVIPNGVDFGRYCSLPVGRRSATPLVLYLGTMSWRANATAAQFLAEVVMPVVRQSVPNARLRIVGKAPPPDVVALARNGYTEVTGAVPDVMPHLQEAHVLEVR